MLPVTKASWMGRYSLALAEYLLLKSAVEADSKISISHTQRIHAVWSEFKELCAEKSEECRPRGFLRLSCVKSEALAILETR